MPNFAMSFGIDWTEIPDGTITMPMLQDGCVGYSKLADEAVHSDKIADGAVTTDKIADDVVSEAKLKTTTKSWSIDIEPDSLGYYELDAHCHFPKQGASNIQVYMWSEGACPDTQKYRLYARNSSSVNAHAWYGLALAHCNTEQEVRIYTKGDGEIVGVEVCDMSDEGNIGLIDRDGNEILLDQYVIGIDDWPEMFEDKICKKHAKELFKMKKELKKRMKKRESYGTEKTD